MLLIGTYLVWLSSPWPFKKGTDKLFGDHVEVACAHKYAVAATMYSVDLVIVLFSVGNTCHRSCDIVTGHTLCCI